MDRLKTICSLALMALALLPAPACDPDDNGDGGVNIGPQPVQALKFIKVTSPTDADRWLWDHAYNITWASMGIEGKVRIHLLHDGAVVAELTNANGTKNDGVFSWTVPSGLYNGDKFQIRITSIEESSVYGLSKNFMMGWEWTFPTTNSAGGG